MTSEEIKNNFLDSFEKCLESISDNKTGTVPFKERNGRQIKISISKSINLSCLKEMRKTLSALYPYHFENQELPLTAWSYLYNEEDPTEPIFWPTSMEQFEQFAKLLDRLGYIGKFKKVEREVDGKKKVDTFCSKIIKAEPFIEKSEQTSHSGR